MHLFSRYRWCSVVGAGARISCSGFVGFVVVLLFGILVVLLLFLGFLVIVGWIVLIVSIIVGYFIVIVIRMLFVIFLIFVLILVLFMLWVLVGSSVLSSVEIDCRCYYYCVVCILSKCLCILSIV